MQDERPWSHEIEVAAIPLEGQKIELVPDAATRKRLAEVANVAAVHELKAVLEIRPTADGGVDVTGELNGIVRQTCVVSLEEFDNPVSETISVDFAIEPKSEASSDDEEEIEDLPDPIVDGKIDLGMLVTEFLILAIDPYARKPGAKFETVQSEEPAPEEKRSPFEGLSGLKDKLKK